MASPEPATGAPRVARLGSGLVVAAAACVLVAFTFVPWMRVMRPDILSDGAPVETTVGLAAIHRDRDVAANAVVSLDYVTWLGWTLLVVMTVSGLLAAVPDGRALRFRWLGIASGALGAVLTVAATSSFYVDADPSDIGTPFPAGDGFGSAAAGAWLALGGFVLGAVGAAVGPGRRTRGRPVSITPPRGRRTVVLALAAVAGVLLVVGFFVVAWYDTSGRDLPEDFAFSSFRSYVAADPSVIVQAYFPALAYATAVLAVGAAACGVLRSPLAPIARGAAIVAGLAGATCTVWALADLLTGPNAPFDGLFDSTASGPYLVVVGYLLAVVSAAIPRGRD